MSDSMADKMKKKLSTKSITAIVLFGAIILVFVFFGLPGRLGSGVGSVARVNDSLISVADFQQEENRVLQYYQNLFGGQMDFSSQRQLLRQQALGNLVRMELVSQGAQSEGVLATDAEVREFIIKEVPFFQQNGLFQRDLYSRYLEATHTTAGGFEAKIRKDVANLRLRLLFDAATSMNAAEQKSLEDLRSVKMNVAFAKVDQEAAEKALGKEKTEAAIKALDEALHKGDEAAANTQLKELKATWDETGLVDLNTDNLPKITSAVANDAAFELKKTEPLLKRLVRDGGQKYVLKLKDMRNEAAKPLEASVMEMMEKRRGQALMEGWLNQYRNNSHVTMNSQALQLN